MMTRLARSRGTGRFSAARWLTAGQALFLGGDDRVGGGVAAGHGAALIGTPHHANFRAERLSHSLAPLALLLASCASQDRPANIPSVQGWQAGPVIDGKNYSAGTIISVPSSGVIQFKIPNTPASVHYITAPAQPLSHGVTIRYAISGNGAVHGAGCAGPSTVVPYLQRQGDDWSGIGKYEAYRWWDTAATGTLTPGEHVVTAKLTDKWTAVITSDNAAQAAAFAAAVSAPARVGFTFSNCTGLGHGAATDGVVTFTLEEFRAN